MHISSCPQADIWNAVARQSPEVTFYHTPAWHDTVVRTFPEYSTGTLLFSLENGSRALFPCLQTEEKRLLKKKVRIKSSVFGGYGGIISEQPLQPGEMGKIYSHLTGLKAALSITTNPFAEDTLPESFITEETCTHALQLPEDPELLSKKLNRGGKSNLNQAVKKGVTVREDASLEAVDTYIALYRDTLQRWGDSTIFTYPDAFFSNLFEAAGEHAKLWLAEADGKIIAGAIVFYWNRVVTYFHGSSLQDYFKHYPNNLLHMEIMRHAVQEGFTLYDFGPSGGQEGVIRFKKSFGAESYTFATGRYKKR